MHMKCSTAWLGISGGCETRCQAGSKQILSLGNEKQMGEAGSLSGEWHTDRSCLNLLFSSSKCPLCHFPYMVKGQYGSRIDPLFTHRFKKTRLGGNFTSKIGRREKDSLAVFLLNQASARHNFSLKNRNEQVRRQHLPHYSSSGPESYLFPAKTIQGPFKWQATFLISSKSCGFLSLPFFQQLTSAGTRSIKWASILCSLW